MFFLYMLAYGVGEFFLLVFFFIFAYLVTTAGARMDIGIWCGIWFVLTQAWGITLAWLADMWTARQRTAEPVAPKPAADQARLSPKQLNRKFASWVEYESESAHAVLFSSLSMWLSPHFPTLLLWFSLIMTKSRSS